MEAPHRLQSAASEGDDVSISHREYDRESIIAVDFGRDVDAEVDVVGDTAIVVAGDEQYEFEIPPEATTVTTNDGILTIRSDVADDDAEQ